MRRSDIDGDGVGGVGGVGVGGSTVEATDLLVPGIGELIGGSAREERLDVLDGLMADAGLLQGGGDEGGEGGGRVAAPSSNLQWYADLRKYGTVPHAGWGMGFERLVQVGVQ
jgi:asparaginyl-tRNA synthetase